MASISHWCLLCARKENVEHEITALNKPIKTLVSDYTILVRKCSKKKINMKLAFKTNNG
jgi:hypothetical protein